MKNLSRYKLILLCLMLFILLLQFTEVSVSQSVYAKEKKIVLFDEVHLQFYNSERLHSAIASLNDSEDYTVFINRQRFSEVSLLGVDILFIGNPERSFTNQELFAISEYLKNGGNLFLLGDPRDNPSNLNDIIDTIQYTDARFSREVIFDEEHNLNEISTQIIISQEDLLESSPIANGVQEICTQSIWVEDNDPTKVVATGSNFSLAGLEGRSQPAWLVASIVGRSRIVLCGSTRMFSDTKPAKSDVTWYQSKDNARLWQNIFSWLAQKDTPPSFLDTISSSISVIISALIIGIVFTGGGLGVYYLFQRKELKPISEILRRKKIETPKPVPEEKAILIPEEEAIPSPEEEEEEEPTEKELPSPEKKKKKKGKKREYRIRR
ncbi:MAG: hypothetical protein ACFFCD_01435 [Promethearchaeota archaeon]